MNAVSVPLLIIEILSLIGDLLHTKDFEIGLLKLKYIAEFSRRGVFNVFGSIR